VGPDVLAEEGDWTAYLDADTTGLVYYFNGKTGESMWEPPTKSFPKISLDRSTKRQAEAKRVEYEKTLTAQQQGQPAAKEEKKKGFLATLMEDEPKADTTASTTEGKDPKEKGGDEWFSFMNEERPAAVEKQEPEKKEGDWFSSLFDDKGKESSDVAVVESKGTKPAEVNGAAATSTEEAVEKQPSFFDRILETTRAQTATKEVPEELIVTEDNAIKVDMAAYVLPHPAKIFWGGEDAVFTTGRTFGVFDGVSGATKLDGVPLYSKTLAKEMKKAVGSDGLRMADITKCLTAAAEFADKRATGASTAIVASIGEDGFLRALNLGDSSCIVIRNGKVTSKTRDISHYFDCPYQLSDDSPDRPRDGTKLNLELVRGDLILMASDGVFDNLSDQQIVDIVAAAPERLSAIAKRVSDQSRTASLNKKAVTPYAKLAKKNGDPDYAEGVGGKLDDVSCVVVRYA
jgi:protein phosphatase PTC7